jgi:hypothetical protein
MKLLCLLSSLMSGSAIAQTVPNSEGLSEWESLAVALSLVATAVFCLWVIRKIKKALSAPLPNSLPSHWLTEPVARNAPITIVSN